MSTCLTNNPDPVTVVITRNVRAGSEQAFEETLKALIRDALTVPDYLGVHIARPTAGHNEYRANVKFRTREAWEAFRQTPEYLAFLRRIRPLLAGEPRVEIECGLESWFTRPGTPLHSLPRWKMALVTLLGVYPTSVVLGLTIGRWASEWHFLLRAFVFAASMVVLLSWVVMPLLNRGLHRWLNSQQPSR